MVATTRSPLHVTPDDVQDPSQDSTQESPQESPQDIALQVLTGTVLTSSRGADGTVAQLSRDQRAEWTHVLLEAARAEPDQRAYLHEAVVVLNCRVADAVAARFRTADVAMEDLRQAAYEGLVKAVAGYDPDVAPNLLTYAVPVIRGAVMRHLRDRTWMIRPPRSVFDLQAKINAAVSHLRDEFGRHPTADEICDYLGVSMHEYDTVELAMSQLRCDSLDRPVGESTSLTVADTVDASETDGDLEAAETRTILEPALHGLDATERRLIQLRFFEDRPYREIADEMGVSTTQVARRIDRILTRMRRTCTDDTTPPRRPQLR